MPSRDRVWLHLSLLVLTVVTTTFVGALHYFGFTLGFGGDAVIAPPLRAPSFYLKGPWYSGRSWPSSDVMRWDTTLPVGTTRWMRRFPTFCPRHYR